MRRNLGGDRPTHRVTAPDYMNMQVVCIVMHMTSTAVAVAGASGYAGGEVLRLLLGHPDVEIGALTGGSQRRRAARHPPAAPGPAGRPDARGRPRPRCWPATTWSSSPCRTASPPSSPRSSATDAVVDRLRRRLPAHRPGGLGAVLRRRPRRLLALRPARAARPARDCSRGATRIAVPGCYPTVSTLALAPAIAAGLVEPDVVVVAASGTSGAGKAAKPHLLGSEVMGNASAYGVGGVHRHTPEIDPEPLRARRTPVSVSFTPVLVPMPRGILATVRAPRWPASTTADGRTRLREGVRRRAVRPPAARRASGRRPSRCSAPTPCTCRSTVDEAAAAGRRRRGGQPGQGHRPAPPCSA